MAAAGVAGGVGGELGKNLDPLTRDPLTGQAAVRSLSNIAGHLAVGGASALASAATRSAIEGTSFGDNLMAGLPDVIGQTLGRALGGAIGDAANGKPKPAAAASQGASSHESAHVQQPAGGHNAATRQIAHAHHQMSSPVANGGGADTLGEAVAAAAEENVIVVTAPRPASSGSSRDSRAGDPRLGFQQGGLPLVDLPSEASVRSALAADSSLSSRIDPKLAGRIARGAARRVAVFGAIWPDPIGTPIEVPILGVNASLTRNSDEALWTLESNGEQIGYIGGDGLENVIFIDTLEGKPGTFAGTSINAIVIRAVDGHDIGFGVSIQTRREAEIYNDGLASGWDSNAINAAIAIERARAGTVRQADIEIRRGAFVYGDFIVDNHGRMPTPRNGRESHHGALTAWMTAHHGGYNPNFAPAVLMPIANHDATRAEYNRWRAEQNKAGPFDWSRVSEGEMRALGNRMFDAGSVPQPVRDEYWLRYESMVRKVGK